MIPVRAKLDDAISRVCMHNNLAYVIDIDNAAYKFINPNCGFDVTNAVLVTLGVVKEDEPAESDETNE